MMEAGVAELQVFFPERDDVGTVIGATLRRDSVKTPQEALIEIYRKLRPGDPPTLDTATALFHGMFFDPRKYDFSRVGRLKFNIKLFDREDSTNLENRTLEPDDFYATIKYLLKCILRPTLRAKNRAPSAERGGKRGRAAHAGVRSNRQSHCGTGTGAAGWRDCAGGEQAWRCTSVPFVRIVCRKRRHACAGDGR